MTTEQTAPVAIEEIYAAYKRFIEQFHAAGGPKRDLMTTDEFSDWWGTLQDSDRENYLAQYRAGYHESNDDSLAAQTILRNTENTGDLVELLDGPPKEIDAELMTRVKSIHQQT